MTRAHLFPALLFGPAHRKTDEPEKRGDRHFGRLVLTGAPPFLDGPRDAAGNSVDPLRDVGRGFRDHRECRLGDGKPDNQKGYRPSNHSRRHALSVLGLASMTREPFGTSHLAAFAASHLTAAVVALLTVGFLLAHGVDVVARRVVSWWRGFHGRHSDKFLRARGLYRAPWAVASRQYRRVMQRAHVQEMHDSTVARGVSFDQFGRRLLRRDRRKAVTAYVRALRGAAKRSTEQP